MNGQSVRLERALERLRYWSKTLDEARKAGKVGEAVAAKQRVGEYTLLVADLREQGAEPLR